MNPGDYRTGRGEESGPSIGGAACVPTLLEGGHRHLNRAGIATFEVSGIFVDADLACIHGLNERIPVKSLRDVRDFSYRLATLYVDQKGS
jgi:acetylornithine deacetylase/succinyl-diaminopimelate desuccinylase-like protein